ncbi:hypothetical protein [Hungatella effluvii]|uniref:hypothetical protein n=1 Tax=Hungatella effluvii TaxID=1096246 RepID=UPI001F598165|nr:hypothetical protein [Hungatella effluvii]
MGTIRNRMVIVHHFNRNIIEMMRKDAIEHFQKLVLEDDTDTNYNVSECMVSPILSSPINGEFSFVVMGDCSKIGWKTSELFERGRSEWVRRWRESDDSYLVLVADFGEDYDAFIESEALD